MWYVNRIVPLQNPDAGYSGQTGDVLAGAALMGPAGALMMANGPASQAWFRVTTADGSEYVCACHVATWPRLGRRIKKTIERTAASPTPERASPSKRQRGIGNAILAGGVLLLPFVFAWLTLRRGYPWAVRLASFGWMVALFLLVSGGHRPAQLTVQPAPSALSASNLMASSGHTSAGTYRGKTRRHPHRATRPAL